MMETRNYDLTNLASAVELSTEAGWNHTRAEWERGIALNPHGCLGGFIDGKLVATCPLSVLGDFG
jgi:hypothetical protein